ncbi:hypothetical protein [Salinisphaera sp. T31B1]|uniref:hypothetical protein n=1 Tax=Salinisphaera sp. T31B1 TaxID=727963 RepID=UPI00334065A5
MRIKIASLAALGLVGLSLYAGTTLATGDTGQTIYLDPDTGDVIDQPPAAGSPAPAARRAAPDQGKGKAWTNADGADMYTPDQTDAPALEAVHCDDGSLRMGHARATHGQDAREALCERNKP